MTWTFKHTRSDRPMVAEYLCPVHGRFELTVDRDANGDPPGEMPCPHRDRPTVCQCGASMIAAACSNLGCFRELRPIYCGRTSPFAISASGYAKVKAVEAVRGGYEKPARETYTNTENLGEGQDLDDWWDDRAKVWDRHRESEIKELANG